MYMDMTFWYRACSSCTFSLFYYVVLTSHLVILMIVVNYEMNLNWLFLPCVNCNLWISTDTSKQNVKVFLKNTA